MSVLYLTVCGRLASLGSRFGRFGDDLFKTRTLCRMYVNGLVVGGWSGGCVCIIDLYMFCFTAERIKLICSNIFKTLTFKIWSVYLIKILFFLRDLNIKDIFVIRTCLKPKDNCFFHGYSKVQQNRSEPVLKDFPDSWWAATNIT